MAATWRFDIKEGWSVRAAQQGVELVRPAIVYGLTIAAGDSDPELLLKVIADPGFPGIGTAFPTTDPDSKFKGATLQRVEVRPRVGSQNTTVRVNLIYSKAGFGNDPTTKEAWTLEDSGNISHVNQAGTFGGISQAQVWYKSGTAATVTTAPAGSDIKTVLHPVMLCSRVLRATAEFTAEQWETSRPYVRYTVGSINSTQWGSGDRGTWFHAPITIRTPDKGKSLIVTLTFLENPKGWYGLGVYHRGLDGQIPQDIATEQQLRATGLPDVGYTKNLNGLVLISDYLETDFASGLPFSPVDI